MFNRSNFNFNVVSQPQITPLNTDDAAQENIKIWLQTKVTNLRNRYPKVSSPDWEKEFSNAVIALEKTVGDITSDTIDGIFSDAVSLITEYLKSSGVFKDSSGKPKAMTMLNHIKEIKTKVANYGDDFRSGATLATNYYTKIISTKDAEIKRLNDQILAMTEGLAKDSQKTLEGVLTIMDQIEPLLLKDSQNNSDTLPGSASNLNDIRERTGFNASPRVVPVLGNTNTDLQKIMGTQRMQLMINLAGLIFNGNEAAVDIYNVIKDNNTTPLNKLVDSIKFEGLESLKKLFVDDQSSINSRAGALSKQPTTYTMGKFAAFEKLAQITDKLTSNSSYVIDVN